MTGTKVIIDSIIEANDSLTKYMKENFVANVDSLAITSGKGGVGKTTIAVNLSIALKKLASEIFLLDTDLGVACSCFIGNKPWIVFTSVLFWRKSITEVIIPCKSGIQLISGGTASSNR